jgi:succinyl-CoA synthetase beta subunit
MKLYEFQGKALFERYGIPTVTGDVASTPEDARALAEKLGGRVAVKAQVLVGGRGKAGGVKIARSPDEAAGHAGTILSMTIKSLPVRKVLVISAVNIRSEYYLALTVDRAAQTCVLIASASGGVDIEELAASRPDHIHRFAIDPLRGLDEGPCLAFLQKTFEKPAVAEAVLPIVRAMFSLFSDLDCSLVEINPLAELEGGEIAALDAKIVADDNGLYRHDDMESLRNPEEYGPDELEARSWGLSFINMDGTIGCIVNGAGLAMATMDLIQLAGGSPANFLDVGGSSSPEKVVHAFEIIGHNEKVTALLINIFGGITRCDDIARGILQAREQVALDLPVVIRLIGTNEEEGRRILAGAGIDAYEDLAEAVHRVVKVSKKGGGSRG